MRCAHEATARRNVPDVRSRPGAPYPGFGGIRKMPLTRTDGETWEAQIPAAMAHGNVEYFITARNEAGQATRQGQSGSHAPYVIAFKSAVASATPPAAAPATATAPQQASGPFIFTMTVCGSGASIDATLSTK